LKKLSGFSRVIKKPAWLMVISKMTASNEFQIMGSLPLFPFHNFARLDPTFYRWASQRSFSQAG
jgi:hypothetical protein